MRKEILENGDFQELIDDLRYLNRWIRNTSNDLSHDLEDLALTVDNKAMEEITFDINDLRYVMSHIDVFTTMIDYYNNLESKLESED